MHTHMHTHMLRIIHPLKLPINRTVHIPCFNNSIVPPQSSQKRRSSSRDYHTAQAMRILKSLICRS